VGQALKHLAQPLRFGFDKGCGLSVVQPRNSGKLKPKSDLLSQSKYARQPILSQPTVSA